MLLELLRAQRRDLTLGRNLMCYESELFLATGAARKLISSWVGIGLRWGIPKVFREYVERDPSIYEEWSHLSFGLRLMAASMGMPFLPTASLLGSDLLERLPALSRCAVPSPMSCSWRSRRSCPTWLSSTSTPSTPPATRRSRVRPTWTSSSRGRPRR